MNFFKDILVCFEYLNGLIFILNIAGNAGSPSCTVPPQPGFSYRGMWIPLVQTFNEGQAKPI